MAKKSEPAPSLITQIATRRLIVTIQGIGPMLINKLTAEEEGKLLDRLLKRPEKKGSKEVLTVDDIAQEKLHPGSNVEAGIFTYPVNAFPLSASKILGLNPKTKLLQKAFRNKMLVSGMTGTDPTDEFDPEFVYIKGEYSVDSRPINNKKAGVMAISVRPKITNWSTTIEIEYFCELTNKEEIIAALTMGGHAMGIGSWRRENGGPYGRYRITKVEEVRDISEK